MATPSYQTKLETAREQIAARIVEITQAPKPDYSIDGESYSHASYLDTLTRQLESLNKLIQQAGSPIHKITIGRG